MNDIFAKERGESGRKICLYTVALYTQKISGKPHKKLVVSLVAWGGVKGDLSLNLYTSVHLILF